MDGGAIFAGAAILALSFLGFDAVSTLSEETSDPRRVIPKAILLCALVGGLVYIFQSYLGQLAFPDIDVFADHQDVASADVMKAIGGDFLNSFFTAAYVAGAFACAMASQASVSRILFAMSRDGSLPKPLFARLHPKYRTPVVANLVVGLFGLTALFISLATVSSMISFGALAAFSFVNLAVVKAYVIDRGQRTPADLFKYGAAAAHRHGVHALPVDPALRAHVQDRARLAGGRLRRAADHHPRLQRPAAADVHGGRGRALGGGVRGSAAERQRRLGRAGFEGGCGQPSCLALSDRRTGHVPA